MKDKEWSYLSDSELDALLESSVSDLAPDDIVKDVTPWRKAIDRILWGIALCTVTLNFLCLNYILPAIGTVALLLGARSLRRENKWFFAFFIIAVIRAVCFFAVLIINASIYQSSIFTDSVNTVSTAASLFIQLLEFICLWRGLISVQKKAGLPAEATAAGALIIWYVLVSALAIVKYSGWVFGIAMIVVYVLIIRSMLKLSEEIEEAGYSIKPAPVRVSDSFIVRGIIATLIVGFVLAYAFCGSYAMDWNAVEDNEQTEVETIKAQLIELGFPEYVLNDLAPEDIKACEGALQVVTDVTDKAVNDGRKVRTEERDEYTTYITEKTVYDVKELRITGVGVQIPGEREEWLIFHHFLWTVDPGFRGTESIQLWTAYRDSDGWEAGSPVTGRVLYDKDGTSFAAPYCSLGEQTFTASNIFWGSQTRTDIFAEFSMPRQGENYRGYIAYSTLETIDNHDINSWINYTHQKSLLQYPVVTAAESRMLGSSTSAFKTVQDALQFFSSVDGAYTLDYAG